MDDLATNTGIAFKLRKGWIFLCWLPLGISILAVARPSMVGVVLATGLSFIYLLFGIFMFAFIERFRDGYFFVATLIGSMPALFVLHAAIYIVFFAENFHI